MYEEALKKGSTNSGKTTEGQEQIDAKLRKAQKLQQLKEKQKKVMMEHLEVEEHKESDHSCIVCRLG
jgi:hypothetical protein